MRTLRHLLSIIAVTGAAAAAIAATAPPAAATITVGMACGSTGPGTFECNAGSSGTGRLNWNWVGEQNADLIWIPPIRHIRNGTCTPGLLSVVSVTVSGSSGGGSASATDSFLCQ